MTTKAQINKASKFLSFVLRHKPDAIGLALDDQGWAQIDKLINKANESGQATLTAELINTVVQSCDKKRFIISSDSQKIRANQGHSIDIDLALKPTEPPEFLYHGTATRFIESIMREGLKKQQRQHVHLSTNIKTATAVGQRYGKPVILTIKSLAMHQQGCAFYLAENGVWLTDSVPLNYILLPK